MDRPCSSRAAFPRHSSRGFAAKSPIEAQVPRLTDHTAIDLSWRGLYRAVKACSSPSHCTALRVVVSAQRAIGIGIDIDIDIDIDISPLRSLSPTTTATVPKRWDTKSKEHAGAITIIIIIIIIVTIRRPWRRVRGVSAHCPESRPRQRCIIIIIIIIITMAQAKKHLPYRCYKPNVAAGSTHAPAHACRQDIHTYIHTYTHLVYREPWEALAWRNVGAHRCNMLLSRGRRWRQSFVVVGFGKDRKHRAMAKMEESMSVSLLMFKLLKSMPKLLKSMSVSLLMSKLSKSMSASLLMSKLLKSMPKPMSLLHASVSHPRSLSAMGSSSSSSTMASWPPKSWNGKGEYATIAGGCFWSVELMVTRIPGKREG